MLGLDQNVFGHRAVRRVDAFSAWSHSGMFRGVLIGCSHRLDEMRSSDPLIERLNLMARRKRKVSRATSQARSEQARSRPRHESGRFLTKAEIAERAASGEDVAGAVSRESVVENVLASQPAQRQDDQRDEQIPAPTGAVTGEDLDAVLSRFEDEPEPTHRRGMSALERSLSRKERKLRL